MFKKIIFIVIFSFFVFGGTVLASEKKDQVFKAEVLEILTQIQNILPDNSVVEQQNLKLLGLEGSFKDKEFIFEGVGAFDLINKNLYQTGDKVVAVASFDDQGAVNFYVTDYIRTQSLWWLTAIFVFIILIIGRFKGLRALLSLFLTFLIIIKYLIPQILNGANPIFISLSASLFIVLLVVYLTEGFKIKSHLAIISIFFSLLLTIAISWFFINVAKLSGIFNEETAFLISLGDEVINFKGLLLAGIILGAIGVLGDVVISQIVAVEQIIKADPSQDIKEIFKKSYVIGISHISSMTNTLFLAYAGASLPLLILFISKESAISHWSLLINNEAIATEIVRTLAGSIGLILAVPIATALAAWKLKRN